MKNHSFLGYVYLLESNGLYKIGYSNHPETRLRRLMTGSACQITIVHTIYTALFREIEHRLHNRFWKKRVHGEWFALDESDVTYIKELDRYGCTKAMRERNEEYRRKAMTQPLGPEIILTRAEQAVFDSLA